MTTNVVRLVDGSEVDSASEDWRHECECRYVMARNAAEQREYSAIVLRNRGQEVVDRMRETMHQMREPRARTFSPTAEAP